MFNDLWLSDSKYSQWLRRDTDKFNAQCAVCKKIFKIGTMGIKSVDSHMQSEKHKRNMSSVGSSVNTIINYTDSTRSTASVANRSGNTSVAGAKPVDKTAGDLRQTFGSNDTLKAEVLWTLHTVTCHQSYSGNDGIGSLFAVMFHDSDIAKSFKCGQDKTAYLAKFGLAPFVKKRLMSHVADEDYVIMFDESLNETTKSKQLDLHIRFWTDDNGSHVQSRYLGSQFMGHTTAQDLLTSFKVGSVKKTSLYIQNIKCTFASMFV